MSKFADSLDAAVQKAFTRPAPKSAGAQMRYLVKQLGGTKAAAQMLRISQRTVERYVKDQIKKPRADLAARLEREVKKRWQPQIRAKARQKAATTGGIVIDTRARMGYTAPIGSTDQDRIRHLTHRPAPAVRRPALRRPGRRRQRRRTPADHRRGPQGGLLPRQRPPRRVPGGSALHRRAAPRVRPVDPRTTSGPGPDGVTERFSWSVSS
ncbi:hypothetical protein Shyd_41010 [Streptomyces hydrogenans]|uniref:XRE family transcriptional regulator n=1 Tax=Streptomyces hydrogenans TaxID=1873719 RepID=A0ABQ3PCI9_9ACTN|nr:hypothetical protein Shyd_41010 [Streptomyces hydrogenans]